MVLKPGIRLAHDVVRIRAWLQDKHSVNPIPANHCRFPNSGHAIQDRLPRLREKL